MSNVKMRILIADDHPVVREGIAAMLGDEPDIEVVALADNGRTAVEAFFKHEPDVALLDIRMPEMDGIEAIQVIRERRPGARIIILTTYNDDEDIYRGLRAGARAYLLKDVPPDELADVIRAVHAGQKWISPEIAARLAERMSSPDLTDRELEVLRLLVDGRANAEIARDLYITEGTVKFHVNNILSKLGANDRAQAVSIALKRGIVHL